MKKATEKEKELLEQFILPYLHINKRIPLLPGRNNTKAEAALFGISEEELSTFRANFKENAKQAALELLKEEEITDYISKLPFTGEEKIVVLGDSISEDAQGWFEILREILTISIPKENFEFINAGVAYNTTSEALRRLDRDVLSHKPDWVFVALGTFDAQRLNIAPDRTLLPLSETWENIETIQAVLMDTVENPIYWITPAPVIPQLLEEHPLYDFTINPTDLYQIQQLVADKQGVVVDPRAKRMGEKSPEAWHYTPDGLHHSLTGHLNVVKLILKQMALDNKKEDGKS